MIPTITSLRYRRLYQRTTVLALVAAAISLLGAIFLWFLFRQSIQAKGILLLSSILGLALGVFSGLVAMGGNIALRRDALERAGKPYFSTRPRERSPGIGTQLRRQVLNLMPGSNTRLRLWPGEWVRVKDFLEIKRSLDETGSLDALPFMPEMLPYCGRRFRVFRRIDKVHDYYTPGGTGLRRLHDSVTLDDLRCNGAAHGGCQAACQFIWKEAWLEISRPPDSDAHPTQIHTSRFDNRAYAGAKRGEEPYICQMTELPKAARLMWWNDPRHYLRDLWSGNVRITPFVKAVALALFNAVQRKTHAPTAPYRHPNDRKPEKLPALELRPGDIVRVRPKHEIETTLTKSKNLGLWFDVEMHRYCGGQFRVAARVQNIIREDNGSMLSLKNPCIVLEGAVGTGEYIGLCPQSDLIFWREVWLERLSGASGATVHEVLVPDSAKPGPRAHTVARTLGPE